MRTGVLHDSESSTRGVKVNRKSCDKCAISENGRVQGAKHVRTERFEGEREVREWRMKESGFEKAESAKENKIESERETNASIQEMNAKGTRKSAHRWRNGRAAYTLQLRCIQIANVVK
jgi:hypothetical protein